PASPRPMWARPCVSLLRRVIFLEYGASVAAVVQGSGSASPRGWRVQWVYGEHRAWFPEPRGLRYPCRLRGVSFGQAARSATMGGSTTANDEVRTLEEAVRDGSRSPQPRARTGSMGALSLSDRWLVACAAPPMSWRHATDP